jgi:hypothetical protein
MREVALALKSAESRELRFAAAREHNLAVAVARARSAISGFSSLRVLSVAKISLKNGGKAKHILLAERMKLCESNIIHLT